MSTVAGEGILIEPIEPSDALKALYADAVRDSFGREPLDGRITVYRDRHVSATNVATQEIGPDGELLAVDTYCTMGPDGTVLQYREVEDAGAQLAHTIKANTVNPAPSRFDLRLGSYREMGFTEPDALAAVAHDILATPGGVRAASMLVAHMNALAEQEKRGDNAVDAGQLYGYIVAIQGNFPGLPQ